MKKILLFMLAGSVLSNEVAAMQVTKTLTVKQQEEADRKDLQSKFAIGLLGAGVVANVTGGRCSLNKLVKTVEEVVNAEDRDIVDTLVGKAAEELVGRVVTKVELPTAADIKAKEEELKAATTTLNTAQKSSKKNPQGVIRRLEAEKLELERELLNMRLAFKQDQLEKAQAAQEVAPNNNEESDDDSDVDAEEAENPKITKLEKEVADIQAEIATFNRAYPLLAEKTDKEKKETEDLKKIGTSKAAKAFHKAFRGDGSAKQKETFSKMFTAKFKKVLKMVMNLFDFIFG